MNTKNEYETNPEEGDARPLTPRPEPLDPEPSVGPEAPEFREPAERGYGWGV
jgi:hypothetical protein